MTEKCNGCELLYLEIEQLKGMLMDAKRDMGRISAEKKASDARVDELEKMLFEIVSQAFDKMISHASGCDCC